MVGSLTSSWEVMGERKTVENMLISNSFQPSAIKADNCVRETKNQHCLKLAAWLLAKGKCRLAALLFSRVGHTHGSLGALG